MTRVRPLLVAAAFSALCLQPAPPARAFDWIAKVEIDADGLKSSDPAIRLQAVRALGKDTLALAAPYLLKALADPNPEVRIAAGRILGRGHVPAAVPAIADWLADPDPEVRRAAAQILGQIRDPRATADLIRALGDLDAEVRLLAVRALADIGTPDVVVPIIGRLSDDKSEVRLAAAQALLALGDKRALIPLVGAFEDSSIDVRIAAIKATGNLGDRRAHPALIRLLDSRVESVVLAAVAALGNLQAVEATSALIDHFGHGSDELSAQIAYALGKIGALPSAGKHGKAALEALCAALAQDSLAPAARAALSLAKKAAVPTLIAHLEGQLPGDPQVAVTLLGQAGDPRATEVLIRELSRDRVSPLVVLKAIAGAADKRALLPVLGLLSSPERGLRLAALEAIEPLIAGDQRAAGVIATLIDDPDPEIRLLAVRYLGLMGARSAVPALSKVARGAKSIELRTAAITALGKIGDERAARLLLETLDAGPPALYAVTADALTYLAAPAARDPLIAIIRDAEHPARDAAARALVGVVRDRRDESVRVKLVRWAQTEAQDVSLAAIAALGAMGDPASSTALIALAEAENPARSRAAIRALGDIGDKRAVAIVRKKLATGDDATAAEAARALFKITRGDKQAHAATIASLLAATESGGFATAVNASAGIALLAPETSGRDRKAAASAIAGLLAHPSWLVRVNAAAAIGRARLTSLAPKLVEMLARDPSREARKSAARALGWIAAAGDAGARGEIERALSRAADNDENAAVRAAAHDALSATGDIPPRDAWVTFHVVDPSRGGAPAKNTPYYVIAADGLATAFYTDARGLFTDEAFPAGPYTRAPKPISR